MSKTNYCKNTVIKGGIYVNYVIWKKEMQVKNIVRQFLAQKNPK